MAKEKDNIKKNKLDIKDIKQNIDSLDKINKITDLAVYGNSSMDDNISFKDIDDKIAAANKKLTVNTGNDILELYSTIIANSSKSTSKNSKEHTKESKKIADNMLFNPETGLFSSNNIPVADILQSESDRIKRYSEYRIIYDNIPQLAQALDTYVDNIMSPDDFTKRVFNLFYNGQNVKDSKGGSSQEDVADNLKFLLEKYDFENKSDKIITNALKVGDEFIAVLNINDHTEKMINESTDLDIVYKDNILSENEVLLSSDEKNLISAVVKEHVEGLNDIKYKDDIVTESEYIKYISDIINRNVHYTESTEVLLEELSKSYSEMTKVDTKKNISHITSDLLDTGISKNSKKNKNGIGTSLNLTGSVIKFLVPDKTIKFEVDGINFGYFYIDELNNGQMANNGADLPMASGIANGDPNTKSPINILYASFTSSFRSKELKNRILGEIISKNIAKKLDRETIANNPQFKNIIFGLLEKNYILNKQIRIVYFSPEEVVHFGDGEDVYYDSLFASILVTAKMYLATLVSTLMLKLVRSTEKRIFYIETDIDEDAEGVVSSFMRDIKTKDFNMNSLDNIDTIMNYIGTFNDYYMPIINGARPVEIDTLQGLNVEINNDFLEYLLKSMISGVGIPPEFLSLDQTELARSLAINMCGI